MSLLRKISLSIVCVLCIGNANATPIISFEIDGNTWENPYKVFNNSTDGEKIISFIMDLREAEEEVCFDTSRGSEGSKCHYSDGRPLKIYDDTETVTGLVNSTLIDADGGVEALDYVEFIFNDFDANEVFSWNIETDLFFEEGDNKDANTGSSFGNELIGALVTVTFDSGIQLIGRMAAIAGNEDASRFVVTSVKNVSEPGILAMFIMSLVILRKKVRNA